MKEKLILVTLDLAARKGLDVTSLADIADAAGIRKASIFSHFSSREELVGELFSYCSALASKQEITISFSGTAEHVLSRAIAHWDALYSTSPLSLFYKIVEQQKLILTLASRTHRSFALMLEGQARVLLETLNETGRLDIAETDLAVLMFSSTVSAFLIRAMDILPDEDGDAQQELEWQKERFIRRFCELYAPRKT
ncbi:regulatory protein TetR [Parasphaerochaeta coccoides DSM 17374]|uniref:Regulatory protein TetR n=2 Tax=Parasphaerochaeta TaxID=3062336 RepID=F4GJG2_PARC1|nr:regulatory protein TetR [Parasphaerochaeta coccoides DSM 17374]